MITLRYFASLRERVGRESESFDLAGGPDAGSMTVSGLRARLAARGGGHALLTDSGARILCAVNQELARDDAPVRDGDEVAFFPPVTGG